MHKIKYIILLIIIFILPLLSCRNKSDSPQKITLSGHFTTTGNMPFIKLVFRTEKGKTYEVVPAGINRFKALQGKKIQIEGMAGSIIMETADKKHSRRIYYIREIKILNGE